MFLKSASLAFIVPPNKACSGWWGFCAFYKHFSGFGLFLLSGIFPARPTTTNANRWAVHLGAEAVAISLRGFGAYALSQFDGRAVHSRSAARDSKGQSHTHVQWLARYRRRPGVQRLRPSPARTPRAAGADRFCDGECARRVLPLRHRSDSVTPRVWHGIEQCAAPHPLRLGQRTLAGQRCVPSPTPRGASVIGGVASCGGGRYGRAQSAFGRPAQHRLPGDGAGRR
jgi:hypothetical protein